MAILDYSQHGFGGSEYWRFSGEIIMRKKYRNRRKGEKGIQKRVVRNKKYSEKDDRAKC